MAAARKDSRLTSPTARARLKTRHQPYWLNISEGLALGYRRGPNGGSWYARAYTGQGKYLQESLGAADDHVEANDETVLSFYQAQEHARQLRSERDRLAGIGVRSAISVSEAAQEYLSWYRSHRKSYHATAHSVVTHILPRFAEVRLCDLKAPDIKTWHEGLAATPARKRSRLGAEPQYRAKPRSEDQKRARRATANRILTVLKAILNRAFEKRLVADDSAWRSVKPFRAADEPVIRFLTEAEATRLVNACQVTFRELVRGALLTGARYGELAALTVSDFNPAAGTLYIRPSKSGKGRHVPLHEDGARFFRKLVVGKAGDELLLARPDGTAWGKNHHVRLLKQACSAARINPAITFHDLRHTYASTLAQRGATLLTISKLLGHSDTRITSRHYAHLTDKELREAVNLLPGYGYHQTDNIVSVNQKQG
jgi:integrase